MQAILHRYHNIASSFYKGWNRVVLNGPISPYFQYCYGMATTLTPKIAYQNNYQPEYTSSKVKYNAPIVLSLFVVAYWLAKQQVKKQEARNLHRQ